MLSKEKENNKKNHKSSGKISKGLTYKFFKLWSYKDRCKKI